MYTLVFSSRRLHTRCPRDWSSDVCSSDLVPFAPTDSVTQALEAEIAPVRQAAAAVDSAGAALATAPGDPTEIGRASCREYEYTYGDTGPGNVRMSHSPRGVVSRTSYTQRD